MEAWCGDVTLGGAWKRGKELVLQEGQKATSLSPGPRRDLQKTGHQDWVGSGHPAVPGIRLSVVGRAGDT